MTQTTLPQKKWRVLIVDDSHETRVSTRMMVATLDDMEVVAMAENGLQAVEMTNEYHPDLILMDVNMPEMDGLTAYSHISKLYPEIACIIISAENDSITLNTAEVIGVQAYLTKPFTLEQLETAIGYVIRQTSQARATYTRPNYVAELERLAAEYVKARRIDDQSVQVLEKLAQNPRCKVYWLKNLVMIYAIRQEWGKLKTLVERLERETKK